MLARTWNGRLLTNLRIKKVGDAQFLENFNGYHIVDDYSRPIRIEKGKLSKEDEFEWRLAGDNTFLVPDRGGSRRSVGSIKETVGKVKGLLDPVSKFQSEARIFANESTLFKCDLFFLQYYPPEHFLSMFRKSRPSVICKPIQEVFVNGRIKQDNTKYFTVRNEELQLISTNFQALVNDSKSKKPKDYAVHRRSLRVNLKKWFIEEWCSLKGPEAVDEQIRLTSRGIDDYTSKNYKYLDKTGRSKPGIAKDGYYLYSCMLFPDRINEKEYQEQIKRSVRTVAKMHWDDIYKPGGKFAGRSESWVERANNKVNVKSVNTYLAHAEAPYRVINEE
ncbi:Uncharacterized protein RNJ44_00471 [Nakaseomyces bracarensis]|uniref:Uncharacterized protein n=1 Tax=Nakaseomyces bracarensis TaxID=273131 RepID=A0ABR4NSR4_9SACH